MKYTTLNNIAQIGLDYFTENFEETDDINDAEVVLVRSTDMKSMEMPEKLLAVARAGIGVNNIPLDKCAEKGIVVFNTPGANSNGVKELVIAGMLLASRDIIGGVEFVRSEAGNPEVDKIVEKKKKAFAGCEIKGKKLGIIGLGAIGQQVANAAEHLGMDVYGFDPYLSVDAAWNLSRKVHHITNVNDIYRTCDYITIHVPLLDSTKGMVGKEAIDLMKKGVVVLNLARDLIVDEEAMVAALESGKVAKYVTDFANPTIASAPNTIITPHLGASTEESEDNCAMMAVRQVVDFIENGNIRNSVNYPSCSLGFCEAPCRIAICHKNIPNMISSFTQILGDAGLNISNFANKSRGEYAYSLLDLDSKASDDVIARLGNDEGVIKVRVVK